MYNIQAINIINKFGSGHSEAIVTKDLKIGIQPITFNKIWGKGTIPSFDVMLAEK